uniref:HAD-IA family hydrolase n=1 Tax=Roseihalotalea indica TaxID=2867963 RepID=A0AA49GTT5_9BACT|nr:HAD-IA family hydrolase [Tunicatimonas sp. TK19036]
MNITTLFFDVGGVLLTNGWDHVSRETAAETFGYSYEEAEARHTEQVHDFECGHISLSEYLDRVLFNEPRSFTVEEYVNFMKELSQPYTENLELLRGLAESGKYLLATINNESLELNEYRINTYRLHEFISLFFSSCNMGVMKPDCEIFRRVLRITRRQGQECLFVDDRIENVEAAQSCGLQAAFVKHPSDLPQIFKEAGIRA